MTGSFELRETGSERRMDPRSCPAVLRSRVPFPGVPARDFRGAGSRPQMRLERAGRVPKPPGSSKGENRRLPCSRGVLRPVNMGFTRIGLFPREKEPSRAECALRLSGGGLERVRNSGLFETNPRSAQIRIGMTTARVFSSSGGVTRDGESSSWNENRISFSWTALIASSR